MAKIMDKTTGKMFNKAINKAINKVMNIMQKRFLAEIRISVLIVLVSLTGLLASCGNFAFFSTSKTEAPVEDAEAAQETEEQAAEEPSTELSPDLETTSGSASKEKQQPQTDHNTLPAGGSSETIVAPAPIITPLSPESEFIKQQLTAGVQHQDSQVDILLLVDNSQSMTGEIEQVTKNLGQLLSELSRATHLKVGLMSAFSADGNYASNDDYTPFSGDIPESIIKINHRVHSWNSLVLASLFYQGEAVMAKDLGISGPDFFREDALKVFVVVTDDNSDEMLAETFFEKLVSGGASADEFRFYGFVGLPQMASDFSESGEQLVYRVAEENRIDSCGIHRPGFEYLNLVMSHLSGALFDICQKDWSDHFAKISEGVLLAQQQIFTLDHDSSLVHEILVDGQKIPLTDVVLSGKTLQFKPGVLGGDSANENSAVSEATAANPVAKDYQITVFFKKQKPEQDTSTSSEDSGTDENPDGGIGTGDGDGALSEVGEETEITTEPSTATEE